MINCTKLRRVEKTGRFPAGTYDGIWGGTAVRFTAYGEDYEAQSEKASKTPGAYCKVTSKEGKLTVEVDDKRLKEKHQKDDDAIENLRKRVPLDEGQASPL